MKLTNCGGGGVPVYPGIWFHRFSLVGAEIGRTIISTGFMIRDVGQSEEIFFPVEGIAEYLLFFDMNSSQDNGAR